MFSEKIKYFENQLYNTFFLYHFIKINIQQNMFLYTIVPLLLIITFLSLLALVQYNRHFNIKIFY